MAAPIEGWARETLERQGVFATLATVMADGSPHQAVIWYLLRDDVIVMNSAVGRIWPSNLLRDSRCNLVIEDGYDWVGVRGRAEAITDQLTAQADIAEMARRYQADDPEKAEAMIRNTFQPQQRISFLLRPERVIEHPDS
jgi:PPOX class probable F420-dependent enzyme